MPTREDYLKQLNYYFKIINEELLSDHEKEIYLNEKYAVYKTNNNPNKLIEDIDEKIRLNEQRKLDIEGYVAELNGNDERIDELAGYIKKFDDDNARINSEIEPLNNRINEINTTITNNDKKIADNNKDITELTTKLNEIDKVKKDTIEAELSNFKQNKEKELKDEARAEYEKTLKESKTKSKDINDKADVEIDVFKKEEKELEEKLEQLKVYEFDQKSGIAKSTREMAEYLNKLKDFTEADKKHEVKGKEYERITSFIGMYQTSIETFNGFIIANKKVMDEVEAKLADTKKNIEDAEKRRDQELKAHNDEYGAIFKKMDSDIIEKTEAAYNEKLNGLNKKFDDEKKDLTDKLNAKTNENNTLKSENETIVKEINPLNEKIKKLEKGIDWNNANRKINVDKQIDYAKNIVKTNLDELKAEKKLSYQFASIHDALHNTNPISTKNGVINGLKVVKQSYQRYFNHSKTAKFFSFLPWTKAAKDYRDYLAIKEQYKRYTNFNDKEITTFIKESRLTGSIAEHASTMPQKDLEKILTIDLVMNNKFEKREDANVNDYLKGIEAFHDNYLQIDESLADKAMAVTYGFMMLEQLGELNRTDHQPRIYEVMQDIKQSIVRNSLSNEVEFNKKRMENIILPKAERQDYIYNFDSVKENDNAVLVHDDAAMVKDAAEIEEIIVDAANNEDDNVINTNSNQVQEPVNRPAVRDELMDILKANVEEGEREYQEHLDWIKEHPEDANSEEIDNKSDDNYTEVDPNELLNK